MQPGRGYNEIEIGESFESAMTLTETHIVMGAGLFGDFNPLHVDESFAKDSRYGTRIAHGYLTSNVMAAQLGMLFRGTAVGYLEHSIRFLAPVRAGDTLTVKWTAVSRDEKPKHDGGIVGFTGTCTNQHGEQVAAAQAKMLAKNRR